MASASTRVPGSPPHHAWRFAIVAGSIVGLSVGAVMMWIAWNHNSQGEFHEAGTIHWAPWLAVGWTWALVVAIPVAGIVYALRRAGTAIAPAEGPPRAG